MKRLAHAAIAASVLAVASTTAVFAMGPTPHTDTSHHPTSPQPKLTKDVGAALALAKKSADALDN